MSARPTPRYGGTRRRAEEEKRARQTAFRVMLFALCIITACAIKLGKGEQLAALRAQAADILNSHTDYAGALETLGRAAAGEHESGENPVAVFGRMLLGLEEDTP